MTFERESEQEKCEGLGLDVMMMCEIYILLQNGREDEKHSGSSARSHLYISLLCPPVCVATCDRETAPAELSQNPKINKRVCVFSLAHVYFSSKRLSRPL